MALLPASRASGYFHLGQNEFRDQLFSAFFRGELCHEVWNRILYHEQLGHGKLSGYGVRHRCVEYLWDIYVSYRGLFREKNWVIGQTVEIIPYRQRAAGGHETPPANFLGVGMMFGITAALILHGLYMTLRLGQSRSGAFPRPLTPEEEREALQRVAAGDIEARNLLVEHNLRLVAHVIKK